MTIEEFIKKFILETEDKSKSSTKGYLAQHQLFNQVIIVSQLFLLFLMVDSLKCRGLSNNYKIAFGILIS